MSFIAAFTLLFAETAEDRPVGGFESAPRCNRLRFLFLLRLHANEPLALSLCNALADRHGGHRAVNFSTYA
jgi:hypothetical protein